jgi:nicotinamidase-related amidase
MTPSPADAFDAHREADAADFEDALAAFARADSHNESRADQRDEPVRRTWRWRIPRLRRDDTLLLIVDVQERLVPAMHQSERFVERCVLLARAAAQLQLPVVVTEQNPQRLGSTLPLLNEVLGQATPQVPIIKMQFSACTPSTWEALRATRCGNVLICGDEAHVCVLQTVLDLLEQDFTVFVAHDAIASRRDEDKALAVERMKAAGAIATSVESAVFELLGEAGTPDFKALLPYIK